MEDCLLNTNTDREDVLFVIMECLLYMLMLWAVVRSYPACLYYAPSLF